MIWHKRKRTVPLWFPVLITLFWIVVLCGTVGMIPPASTGCTREEIISFMDGIIEPQDYNPAFLPPPRRPQI